MRCTSLLSKRRLSAKSPGAALGLALALSSLVPSALLGQTTAGSIVGTVRDESGAEVAAAALTIANLATGVEQRTSTNSAGLYKFPNVPVGRYSVRVELLGFQTQVRREVEVALATAVVVDFSIKVGQLAESIDVSGVGETLSPSGQLDARIENVRVQELPMQGRDAQSLVLLAPGVTPTGAGVSGSGVNLVGGSSNNFGQVGTSFSSNGSRARSNNYQIDGIDDNDPARSGGRQAVIQDAVQELVLIQNNFSAEYGRTTGAIVNLITKSGTNEFRGSAFWFRRDEGLNSLNNLDRATQAADPSFEKPPFDANQLGGSVGGPIRRNRTFFFAAYQRQKIDSLAGTSRIFTPTAAGMEALRGQVAAGQASPATVALLERHVPVAPAAARTSPVNGQAIPVGPVTLNSLFAQEDDNFTFSIDHALGPKDQLRARLNFDRNQAQVPGALPEFGGAFRGESLLFSLTETHGFSPTVFNELRFGISRSNQRLSYDLFGGLAEISVRELGFQIGPQTNGDKIDKNTNLQLVDNLSLTRGRHFLKLGVDVRRIKTDEFALFRQRGQYVFNTFQDFVTNTMRPGNAVRTFGPGLYEGRTTALYAFIQDDFKVSPSLTLNLGLRYEIQTIPGDGYYQGLNAEVQSPAFRFGKVKPDTNNLGPRLGFSWRPARGRTVLRGGFGISHDVYSEIYAVLQLPPEFQQTVVATAVVQSFLPAGLQAPPLPATPEQRRARNLGGIPTGLQFPQSKNWTIGIQRELASDLVAEARYVGTRGDNLPARLQRNSPVVIQPLPQLGRPLSPAEADALPVPPTPNVRRPDPLSGLYTEIGGFSESTYHAAQVLLTKRYRRGYLFNAAYTFSRFRDTGSEPLATTFATPIFPQNFDDLGADWGPSLYDRPHRLVVSYVVDLPIHKLGGPGWLSEGWRISGITSVQSGQPFTALNGVDSNGDNQSGNDRVSFNPGGAPGSVSLALPIRNSQGAVVGYYNSDPTARYLQLGAQTGRTGDIGRNSERTDAAANFDVTLAKKTRLAGRLKLELRADFFNLFNRPQFGIPTDAGNAFSALTSSFVTVSSPNFMRPEIGAGSARVVQLAVRLEF